MVAKRSHPRSVCTCGSREIEILVPLGEEERAALLARRGPSARGITHKVVWTPSGRLDAIRSALSIGDSVMAAYYMRRWAPFIEENADDAEIASLGDLRTDLAELEAHEAVHGRLSRLDRDNLMIVRYERDMKRQGRGSIYSLQGEGSDGLHASSCNCLVEGRVAIGPHGFRPIQDEVRADISVDAEDYRSSIEFRVRFVTGHFAFGFSAIAQ